MRLPQIQEGTGWRVGWDATAADFQGLLAGQDWAIELTAAEFYDFCRLVQSLAATMTAMATELMDQEQITCEQETEYIWVTVEGLPTAFSLRFILLTGRRGEGGWPSSPVPELIRALDNLTLR